MTREKSKKYLWYTTLSYLPFIGIFRESIPLMILPVIFVIIGWLLWLFTDYYKTAFIIMLLPWVPGTLIIFKIFSLQDVARLVPGSK